MKNYLAGILTGLLPMLLIGAALQAPSEYGYVDESTSGIYQKYIRRDGAGMETLPFTGTFRTADNVEIGQNYIKTPKIILIPYRSDSATEVQDYLSEEGGLIWWQQSDQVSMLMKQNGEIWDFETVELTTALAEAASLGVDIWDLYSLVGYVGGEYYCLGEGEPWPS